MKIHCHHHHRSRLTLFSSLVLSVFILFVATAILSGVVGYIFMKTGVLGMFSTGSRFPVWLVALLAPCILIGTVLTLVLGRRPLRPFQRLIHAYQEVAAGNFAVRLPIRGPKEMQILNESFNEMAKELGSIETLRNDFVSNISHEFKTPVASIKGFAKLLRKEELPPERKKEYLDIIIAESERLSRLSSNVLLLSKLDTQKSIGETARYSLDEQIRRSILVLEPQCRQKDLSLDIDLDPVMIETNEDLFHQVWLNLLSNAVKFSEPGGRIAVTLRETDAGIAATVSDEGVGMDDESKKRLFDKFYQGDHSRATEGNGLGMSLVRRIVELSGGAVSVESEVGKGTAFVVTLPHTEAAS